ncbi:MAG: hypothetical protein BWY73_01336 [candidate division TA06 bacterium ADurb.Bin417]|uniref:Uncharacterized protein n=1 Tax=candidate division TA06 bacterium ADurb.Bin417 TaxID=1852828 RepID=A0A1V5MBS5_UNCT6|nr:MAG: hypothetical protein BWY73_01336 [candidate division TA06 bacterium ADurb.Bin417]
MRATGRNRDVGRAGGQRPAAAGRLPADPAGDGVKIVVDDDGALLDRFAGEVIVVLAHEISRRAAQVEEERQIDPLQRFAEPAQFGSVIDLAELEGAVEEVAADAVGAPGAQHPGVGQVVNVVPDFGVGVDPGRDLRGRVEMRVDHRLGHLRVAGVPEVAGVLLQQDDLLAPLLPENGLVMDGNHLHLGRHQRIRPVLGPDREPLLALLDRRSEAQGGHDTPEIAAGPEPIVEGQAAGRINPVQGPVLLVGPVIALDLLGHDAADLGRVAMFAVDVAVAPPLPGDDRGVVADLLQQGLPLLPGGFQVIRVDAGGHVEDHPAGLVGRLEAVDGRVNGREGPVGILADRLQAFDFIPGESITGEIIMRLAPDG